MAFADFMNWLHVLHFIIDAEHPDYDRNPDRWRPYFNADYEPRRALQADMKRNAES